MDIMIRKLTRDDWQQYKELRLECLKNTSWAFGARYEEELLNGDDYWQSIANNLQRIMFAIYVNEQIVAMAGLYLPDNSSQYNTISLGQSIVNGVKLNPKSWFIVSVYAKPDYRGQGNVERLLRYLIEYHQQNHSGDLLLGVEVNNIPAIALYKKLGFIYQGDLPARIMGDWQLHQEVLMRLVIG